MNRKDRRARASQSRRAIKKAKKSGSDIETKMALFGHLPDKCVVCIEPFDKNDRDMVMSWNVVVREKEGKVNLYCPDCWNKAHETIEEFRKRMEKKK